MHIPISFFGPRNSSFLKRVFSHVRHEEAGSSVKGEPDFGRVWEPKNDAVGHLAVLLLKLLFL